MDPSEHVSGERRGKVNDLKYKTIK